MTDKLLLLEHTEPKGIVDVKRFHVPFRLSLSCDCGKLITQDFSKNEYLMYPELGKPFRLIFWCKDCEKEHYREVVLNISLTPTGPYATVS